MSKILTQSQIDCWHENGFIQPLSGRLSYL